MRITTRPRPASPRIHVGTWANPLDKDLTRCGDANVAEHLERIAAALPAPYRLTASQRVLRTTERPEHGGRNDDDERVRDLTDALRDPQTRAIVALSGGGWMSRLLPRIDWAVLARRPRRVWVLGFSELTGLVNAVASVPRGGRGLYWLCPNYLAWKITPRCAALEAITRFWRSLPTLLDRLDGCPADGDGKRLLAEPVIHLTRLAGRLRPGPVRVVGGCLSVLAALAATRWSRRLLRPDAWLLLEDLNEPAYRNDRHLAALTNAGWFASIAGVLLGDFHAGREQQADEVLRLLGYHLRAAGRANVPILHAPQVGHVWPMTPVPLNVPLDLHGRGRALRLAPPGWR